ncbi:MAG: DUF4349 domain-containing protein [Chitinispirillales bacterium]|nr:DUF4349 domain-containing protein [Chitinispirillales bacterium]
MSNAMANSAVMVAAVRRAVISIIMPVILFALSSCGSAKDRAPDASYAADGNSARSRSAETDKGYGSGIDDGGSGGGIGDLLGGSMAGGKRVSDRRMVAYSISLALIVKDIDEARAVIIESVKRGNGFIVEESKNYVAARIPPEGADEFINASKALGKTEGESITGTDITDQYRDNVIRLDNVKSVRQRYLALLEKAHTVNEILSIERELQRVNLEIEVLEGRIKYAEQSVEYSYVRVSFREKTRPGPVGWVFYGLYRGVKWLFVW